MRRGLSFLLGVGAVLVTLAIISFSDHFSDTTKAQSPAAWHDVGGGIEAYSVNSFTTCYRSTSYSISCVRNP